MSLIWLLAFVVVDFWLVARVGPLLGGFRLGTWLLGAALLGVFVLRHSADVLRWTSGRRQPAGAQAILERALLLVSGLLLLLPGPIGDVLGVGLLFPLARRPIAGRLSTRLFGSGQASRGRFGTWRFGFGPHPAPDAGGTPPSNETVEPPKTSPTVGATQGDRVRDVEFTLEERKPVGPESGG